MDDSVRPHLHLHLMPEHSLEGSGFSPGAYGERSRLTVVGTSPAHFRLAWHERQVSSAIPGQYRICAPLHGGPFPANANAELTRLLDQLWVRPDAVASAMHPTITSVVATIGRGAVAGMGGGQVLTVLLTAENVGDGARVHGAGMGRQLRTALAQLAQGA